MFFSGRSPPWRALHKTGLVVMAAGTLCLAGISGSAQARSAAPFDSPTPAATRGGSVPLAELPRQAQNTYRLILAGGPFASKRDGIVFGNRERALPAEPRGFYHEYTVPTPGAHDRGARRIVCGGRPVTQPEACYYTADHYASFSRIAP